MKLVRKNESGQILILVLILLALGVMLVAPMLRLSYTGQKYNQIVEINTLNAYAADAGIEYCRYAIYNYPAEIQQSPLDEDLVINGADVHVTAEWDYTASAYRINSTAGSAQRSVSIECLIVVDVGLFGNVIACDGNLEITNCNFVNEDYPGESDVYTHGNIEITNSYIDGDVKASGTISYDVPTEITGEVIEGTVVLVFPTIDPQIHEDRAKLGGTWGTGTETYNTGDETLGPLYIDGDLRFGGGDDVVLAGTVYVTGNVDMGNADVTGFGDIVAEGDLYFNNYSYTVENPVTLPLLMTVGAGKGIDLGNDRGDGTMAILYAPSGEIHLGTVDVMGSVAAPLVTLNNASIEYPAELRGRADLPGAGLDTVTYTFQ
ncbi:hypothetical protein ACFLWS_08420 [Chloroflexota bacterium]